MSDLERTRVAADARRALTAGTTVPSHLDPIAASSEPSSTSRCGRRRTNTDRPRRNTRPGPHRQPRPRRIAVGIDGSESARVPAIWAADEASRRGTTLRLVHALDIQPAMLGGGPNLLSTLRAQGRRWLDDVAAAVRDGYPDLVVDTELRTGAPVRS